jgi:hypothetical protein
MEKLYVEDLLYKLLYDIKVETPDRQILESICRQTEKGTALTDRQYNLVTEKLKNFEDVLEQHNIVVDTYEPRLPLRQIDRRKYIKIVDDLGPNVVYESYKSDWKWIKVRFPFNKKDIVKVNQIGVPMKEYHHSRGSHEHFYKLNGRNVNKLLTLFATRNFEIDEKLVEYNNKVTKILKDAERFTNSFANVIQNFTQDIRESFVGKDDLYIADRSLRYQYKVPKQAPKNLTDFIAYRSEPEVCVDPEAYEMKDIVKSIEDLDRYPLLVLIDQDMAFSQLIEIHQEVSKYVDNSLQSVLFRVDSNDKENADVNSYIQQHTLNNWVDKNTKVVYVKKNKLPKILLQSDFVPFCSLSKTSIRSNTHVKSYVELYCDCILYHDASLSFFRRLDGKL